MTEQPKSPEGKIDGFGPAVDWLRDTGVNYVRAWIAAGRCHFARHPSGSLPTWVCDCLYDALVARFPDFITVVCAAELNIMDGRPAQWSEGVGFEAALDILGAGGVTRIEIEYGGQGDEGDITRLEFLPQLSEPVKDWEDAFSELFEDELRARNPFDWCNDDGGHGKATIDVATGVWSFDHHQHVMTAERYRWTESTNREVLTGSQDDTVPGGEGSY
jgi:hypothetical protein